jgi:hypothetical protein
MQNHNIKSILCLVISSLFLLNLCLSSYSQEPAPIAKTGCWNELYKSVADAYGFDQALATGMCYEDDYQGKVGHPFLFEDQFYKGTLKFRGRAYQGVEIKYDIYKQQVILYIMQNSSVAWIIPPNEFISSFSLNDKWFEKFTFHEGSGFYQVVFDTPEMKCLYHWSKLRYDSDHKKDFNSSRFTESERKTYLLVDNDLKKYSDNKSFVRLFPQKNRQQIKQYMKNNKIKVSRSSESEIVKLLTFCRTL